MDEGQDEIFEALLRHLRDTRGVDFTGYKRASLMRRVRHRMGQLGHENFDEYLDVLQASADEFTALFNTVLINVTTFFRDPDAWDYLAKEVIPAILAERGPSEPIRLWSAGCASGQEAYSLAMLFAEAMGTSAYRERVKIYGTDIDEDALIDARAASYDTKAVESVPPDLLEKYFEHNGGRYVFRPDLRRTVIFGRNDLVRDAPISRVDLLVCRNTLMYLNAETQQKVLSRLHFALSPHGTLFLGHAEMLLSHTDNFAAVSLKHRVFRKMLGSHRPASRFDFDASAYNRSGADEESAPLRESAFRAGPVPQIVVGADDTVVLFNQQAETMFGLSPRDTGRLLRDLEISYRPIELRGYVEQVRAERRPVRIQDVRWQRPRTDIVWFEIHINPLPVSGDGQVGVSIVYIDVTATKGLLDKLMHTNHQLEAAYEELQSTNEELETTNEELQSTVEELETTNEELQSTNEELETMNEELQSTNDELHTINDMLRERGAELESAQAFIASLINSVHLAMMVVDREMRVVVWNRGAEELWGVRTDEAVGTPLSLLDIGLPFDLIRPLIGQAFVDPTQTAEATVDAVNRRGRATSLRVTASSFQSGDEVVDGALLLMEPSS